MAQVCVVQTVQAPVQINVNASLSLNPNVAQNLQAFRQKPLAATGRGLILRVDPASGQLGAVSCVDGDLEKIKASLPQNEPRFVVYRFKNAAGDISTAVLYTALSSASQALVQLYDRYVAVIKDQLKIAQIVRVPNLAQLTLKAINGAIGLAIDAAGNIAKTAAYIAEGAVAAAAGAADGGGANIVGDVISGVLGTATGVLGGVVDAGVGVVGGVVDAASNVLETGVGVVGDVVKAGVGVLGGLADTATDVVGDVVGAATGVVGGIVDTAGGLVGSLVGGLADSVGGIVGGLAGSLGSVVGGITHAFHM